MKKTIKKKSPFVLANSKVYDNTKTDNLFES